MKPSKKDKRLEAFLENNWGRSTTIKRNKCIKCGKAVKDDSFVDDLSYREYLISGMCQDCQDNFFVEE